MTLNRSRIATIAAAATLGVTWTACGRSAPAPRLEVLSSSPTLVSGGDPLVMVFDIHEAVGRRMRQRQ